MCRCELLKRSSIIQLIHSIFLRDLEYFTKQSNISAKITFTYATILNFFYFCEQKAPKKLIPFLK